jgi:hypothetical protein
MSKRLQILLDEEELVEIRRAARRQRTNVSDWVRQALRQARRSEPQGSASRKIEVIRTAARNQFPTAELDRMLAEIEQGYLVPGAP